MVGCSVPSTFCTVNRVLLPLFHTVQPIILQQHSEDWLLNEPWKIKVNILVILCDCNVLQADKAFCILINLKHLCQCEQPALKRFESVIVVRHRWHLWHFRIYVHLENSNSGTNCTKCILNTCACGTRALTQRKDTAEALLNGQGQYWLCIFSVTSPTPAAASSTHLLQGTNCSTHTVCRVCFSEVWYWWPKSICLQHFRCL